MQLCPVATYRQPTPMPNPVCGRVALAVPCAERAPRVITANIVPKKAAPAECVDEPQIVRPIYATGAVRQGTRRGKSVHP